jgi:O-antigen/teichoic acid export membrane protein
VAALCGLLTAGAALVMAGWMQPAWAILAGLGVSLRIAGWVPFQFALGLNRVGTWMAEQAWRQWVMLALLLALLPPLGLNGALLALVFMEVLFCLLGWWWVRDYWLATEFRLDWPYLQPYLRAGLGFFLANLAAVALYRSGPALVEIFSHNSTETGYLNLALGLFLMAYVTFSQFAQGLIPALSQFVAHGRPEQVELWLGNFVRYTWLLGWIGTVGVWLAADRAAPLIFGRDFGPAALSLKWISLGIPFAALLWAGNVSATVAGRGRLKFGATLAGLVIFLLAGPGLISLAGAAGAAAALSLAVIATMAGLSLVLRTGAGLGWWTLWPGTIVAGLSLPVLFWLN